MKAFKQAEDDLGKVYKGGTIAWIDAAENGRFSEAIQKRDRTLEEADRLADDEQIRKCLRSFKAFAIGCCERFDARQRQLAFEEFVQKRGR